MTKTIEKITVSEAADMLAKGQEISSFSHGGMLVTNIVVDQKSFTLIQGSDDKFLRVSD